MFRVGDRVRLSEAGKQRLRTMPEAWGMHAAASRDEIGLVEEVIPADDESGERLSVEFPSGGVYNWDAAAFERVERSA
jgi:hypothetical protein